MPFAHDAVRQSRCTNTDTSRSPRFSPARRSAFGPPLIAIRASRRSHGQAMRSFVTVLKLHLNSAVDPKRIAAKIQRDTPHRQCQRLQLIVDLWIVDAVAECKAAVNLRAIDILRSEVRLEFISLPCALFLRCNRTHQPLDFLVAHALSCCLQYVDEMLLAVRFRRKADVLS